MTAIVEGLASQIAPLWVEVCFLLCFLLGFALLRIDLLAKKAPKKARKVVEEPPAASRAVDAKLLQAVEAEARPEVVLAAWKAGRKGAPSPPELFKPVVQALLELQPNSLVQEVVSHVRQHPAQLCHARTAVMALDVLARAGSIKLMEDMHEAFRRDLGVHPTLQTYEVLLGGYATAGDEKRVKLVVAELATCRYRLSPRGLCLMIKGFLKNGMADQVLEQFRAMSDLGFQVPPFAVTQLFRIACDAGRGEQIFEEVMDLAPMPSDAIAAILEDCCKRGNFRLAKRVEEVAREKGVALVTASYDALLKLNAVNGDQHAIELFREVQAIARVSEGLCVGLLARCAESHFLRFAEEIVQFERARGGMSIAVYSALMKVYAYCGMYGKACDLYDRILEDGLQPDAMMYGCLMKFAVECGRTSLSHRLSEIAPSLDIQNYMSLIRAAGRDKDMERAFAVLNKLKASSFQVDAAAYNCVLDVCVSAGEMERAKGLLQEMRVDSHVDIVTYNTLLKGYCNLGDINAAKALMAEMVREGFRPNDVSYNCVLNVAATSGNFRDAWATISMMEQDGVKVDNYTISIMMKGLKRSNNPRDVQRVLALLDRSGIPVCSDEILANTVLETCIRHKELRRIEAIVAEHKASALRPSVHTYGSLIKACSTLQRLDECWNYWREMHEVRGIEPNEIVLGCMLDALVCNQAVDQAVALLEQWKTRVKPNSIMYSTVIKGFANTGQAERAMSTWREMRSIGITLNTVVYNSVIDAQARVGAMDGVSELVATMSEDGVVPDAITHSTIAKGYCMKGDLDKAFEVFRDMQRNKVTHDSIVYNTILDGCTRHSRFDLADELLADMEKLKITPSNYTLGIMVKMYGRRRQLDKAFEIVDSAQARFGFSANTQVLTCLMGACLNNNALDKAFRVFKEVKRVNRGADGKAFGSMVGGCVRRGELQKAVELVEEAYGLSTGPGLFKLTPGQFIAPENLEKLFQALADQGQAESVAIPLLDKLRAVKVTVSSRLYSALINASPSSGRRGSAARSEHRGGHRRKAS